MKYDPKQQQYFILEANVGRPTVMSLDTVSGVNLMYTMYADVNGLPLLKPLRQNKKQIKWYHLHYDTYSALYYIFKGDLTLLKWARSLKGPKFHALLSSSDSKPFFTDIYQTIAQRIRKLV